MAKRVVISGILDGPTIFLWTFLAREFLPLVKRESGRIPMVRGIVGFTLAGPVVAASLKSEVAARG